MADSPKKPSKEEIAAFNALKTHEEKGKFLDENPHLQVLFPRVNYPGAHEAATKKTE